LLRRAITAAEALQKIRKLVAPAYPDKSKFLVLIGSEVLEDSGRFLRDYTSAGSGELTAQLLGTSEVKVIVRNDGQVNASFSVPSMGTIRDVALLLESDAGIHLSLQRFSFGDAVVPPSAIVGTFHQQPLQLSLHVLDESSVVRVPCIGSSAEAEYMITSKARASSSNVTIGQYIMLKDVPCETLQVVHSRGGKSGHPKIWISGRGIFSNRVYQDIVRAGGYIDVPIVTRRHYQVLDADAQSGQVSLLKADGGVKDDVDLPSFTAKAHEHVCCDDSDQERERLLLDFLEQGEVVMVETVTAVGIEKIVAVKRVEQKD